MFDYDAIKAMAKAIKRPVLELLALAGRNDPFCASMDFRRRDAEWFAGVWSTYGVTGTHLRRIHYKLISQPKGVILKPSGREYQNTDRDFQFLVEAGRDARYLGLVPHDALIDQRNDPPMFFAVDHGNPNEGRSVSCGVYWDEADVDIPDLPDLPGFSVRGLDKVRQDFLVEVWIEKSTQNDWLVPICRERGINLVVGLGEQSETRSRELAVRSAECSVPVRVIYLSDFDPGGRSMPKAVARKVEFTIAKFELDVDLQLIPLALTPEQVRTFHLPPVPMKAAERRQDKFMETFGVEGATELDALEALNPGELARLLNAELDNFLDPDLAARTAAVRSEHELHAKRIEVENEEKHQEEIDEITERFAAIISDLQEWKEEADVLWQTITDELEEKCPDLSDVEIPRSEAPGETDSFVLFDSKRSYFEQMDFYNAWREGSEE